jgi:hypothetical protein
MSLRGRERDRDRGAVWWDEQKRDHGQRGGGSGGGGGLLLTVCLVVPLLVAHTVQCRYLQ